MMASISLTKEQREAIEKAKASGTRRIRMELTDSQRQAMAKVDAEVEQEKEWIEAKSRQAKRSHEAAVLRIADLLKSAREAAGLSLTQVAQRTGMTRQAISRIESGENRNPTMTTIFRIAEALNKELVFDLQDVA